MSPRPFKCVKVLEHFPVQIESIAHYGNFLLLGASNGHLLKYKVRQDEGTDQYFFVITQSQKEFSKKAIMQMEVVEDQDILITLSDSIVRIHALTELTLKHRIADSKGATSFSIDFRKKFNQDLAAKAKSTFHIGILVKRKVLIYSWANGALQEVSTDLSIPEFSKSFLLAGDCIAFLLRRDYCIMKINDGKQTSLFPWKQAEPLIYDVTLAADSSLIEEIDGVRVDVRGKTTIDSILEQNQHTFLIMQQDDNSIMVVLEPHGKVSHRFVTAWSSPILAIGYKKPYFLAITKDKLEVRVKKSSQVVQTLQLNDARALYCRESVYISSYNAVWLLEPVPYKRQALDYLEENDLELAMTMAQLVPDGDSEKSSIKNQVAGRLFCKTKFAESIAIYDEIKSDPVIIIGHLPGMLPERMRQSLIAEGKIPRDLPPLVERDLKRAMEAVMNYLASVRMYYRLKSGEERTAETIDTALLKLYLAVNEPLAPLLLRVENSCELVESEKVLIASKKYTELLLLYQSRRLHQKALELLRDHEGLPSSPLRGCSHTVQYLNQLGPRNMELVVKFSESVLRSHPDEGLKIFTAETPEVESYPREAVLRHLEDKAPALVIPYLEHITAYHEDSRLFHNKLVLEYINRIVSRSDIVESNSGKELSQMWLNEEATMYRSRLRNFLETTSQYEPQQLLGKLPRNRMHEERVLLLGRMGRFEEALVICVHILKDTKQAAQFCWREYNRLLQDKEDADLPFFTLAKLYLQPESCMPIHGFSGGLMMEARVDLGIQVFLDHLPRICSYHVLELLSIIPDGVPVHRLERLLSQVFQEHSALLCSSQITRALLACDQLQVHHERILLESRKRTVTLRDRCRVCGTELGTSAFAWYVDGSLAHFSCFEEESSRTSAASQA